MATYDAVLETQRSTTFYRIKCVAELKIVDGTRYTNLQAGAKNLIELNSLCKTVLTTTLITKVAEMRRDGKLLPN